VATHWRIAVARFRLGSGGWNPQNAAATDGPAETIVSQIDFMYKNLLLFVSQ
jgi:hypothetical protein